MTRSCLLSQPAEGGWGTRQGVILRGFVDLESSSFCGILFLYDSIYCELYGARGTLAGGWVVRVMVIYRFSIKLPENLLLIGMSGGYMS